MLVLVLVVSIFAAQDPLFMAKFGSVLSSGGPDISVTPVLIQNPTAPWATSGLAYTCGSEGEGLLQVTNNGNQAANITAVTLTYGGTTYTADGPSCDAPPGTSVISLTGLSGSPPPAGVQFKGRLTLGSGALVAFAGTWA